MLSKVTLRTVIYYGTSICFAGIRRGTAAGGEAVRDAGSPEGDAFGGGDNSRGVYRQPALFPFYCLGTPAASLCPRPTPPRSSKDTTFFFSRLSERVGLEETRSLPFLTPLTLPLPWENGRDVPGTPSESRPGNPDRGRPKGVVRATGGAEGAAGEAAAGHSSEDARCDQRFQGVRACAGLWLKVSSSPARFFAAGRKWR